MLACYFDPVWVTLRFYQCYLLNFKNWKVQILKFNDLYSFLGLLVLFYMLGRDINKFILYILSKSSIKLITSLNKCNTKLILCTLVYAHHHIIECYCKYT